MIQLPDGHGDGRNCSGDGLFYGYGEDEGTVLYHGNGYNHRTGDGWSQSYGGGYGYSLYPYTLLLKS